MDKEQLIEEVLAYEWQMFITVNDRNDHNPLTAGRPSCRDFPDEFKVHRSSQFIAWSAKSLTSYLHDLRDAQQVGRNLMTYKYARMENLIPCKNTSPLIAKISAQQLVWQKEFIKKHPKMMSGGRALNGDRKGIDWASFETYLTAELETYSENTLDSLYQDVCVYKERGTSMSDAVYDYLVAQKGYSSPQDVEKRG